MTNNEALEKIDKLKKKLEATRIELENVKSENLHLEIKVKDNEELIIYLKKHLELKSMNLEEYYQRYIKVYSEHHLLKNKHTVLSNRFSQYELIVKTSKSMLEALRNRKNAKTQTDIFRNHDIAIMTDLVGKDISHSGIMPSISSNRSELSLYPDYKRKLSDNKKKVIKPSKSFYKDISDESDKLIKLEESVDDSFPKGSNKTVALLKQSKVKFSFMESQISTIRKVISRYDSKKSSESAEELGVDLFETINQIEKAQEIKKMSNSFKTKQQQLNPRSNKRSKSVDNTQSRNEDMSLTLDEKLQNKTSPSLDERKMNKRQPLMRRKLK